MSSSVSPLGRLHRIGWGRRICTSSGWRIFLSPFPSRWHGCDNCHGIARGDLGHMGKLPGYVTLRLNGDRYFHSQLSTASPDDPNASVKRSVIVAPLADSAGVQSAMAAFAAIGPQKPRLMVLISLAAALPQPRKMKLGDVLVSEQLVHLEPLSRQPSDSAMTDIRTFTVDSRLLQAARRYAEGKWRDLITAGRPDSGRPAIHFGTLVDADPVLVTQRGFGATARSGWQTWDWSPVRQAWPPPPRVTSLGVRTRRSSLWSRESQRAASAAEARIRGGGWRSSSCDAAAAFVVGLLRSSLVRTAAQSDDQP